MGMAPLCGLWLSAVPRHAKDTHTPNTHTKHTPNTTHQSDNVEAEVSLMLPANPAGTLNPPPNPL